MHKNKQKIICPQCGHDTYSYSKKINMKIGVSVTPDLTMATLAVACKHCKKIILLIYKCDEAYACGRVEYLDWEKKFWGCSQDLKEDNEIKIEKVEQKIETNIPVKQTKKRQNKKQIESTITQDLWDF